MVICPKCNGVNTKNEGDSLFSCTFCFHSWNSDAKADQLYAEWVELDKSNRLVAQVMKPSGKYNVQYLDQEKLLRRTEVAVELRKSHQQHLDLQPDIWYRIFQDAQ